MNVHKSPYFTEACHGLGKTSTQYHTRIIGVCLPELGLLTTCDRVCPHLTKKGASR